MNRQGRQGRQGRGDEESGAWRVERREKGEGRPQGRGVAESDAETTRRENGFTAEDAEDAETRKGAKRGEDRYFAALRMTGEGRGLRVSF